MAPCSATALAGRPAITAARFAPLLRIGLSTRVHTCAHWRPSDLNAASSVTSVYNTAAAASACVFGSSEPMSPLSRARSRAPPARPSLLPLTQHSCMRVGRLPHCTFTSMSAATLSAEPSRPNFPVSQSPCRGATVARRKDKLMRMSEGRDNVLRHAKPTAVAIIHCRGPQLEFSPPSNPFGRTPSLTKLAEVQSIPFQFTVRLNS